MSQSHQQEFRLITLFVSDIYCAWPNFACWKHCNDQYVWGHTTSRARRVTHERFRQQTEIKVPYGAIAIYGGTKHTECQINDRLNQRREIKGFKSILFKGIFFRRSLISVFNSSSVNLSIRPSIVYFLTQWIPHTIHRVTVRTGTCIGSAWAPAPFLLYIKTALSVNIQNVRGVPFFQLRPCPVCAHGWVRTLCYVTQWHDAGSYGTTIFDIKFWTWPYVKTTGDINLKCWSIMDEPMSLIM